MASDRRAGDEPTSQNQRRANPGPRSDRQTDSGITKPGVTALPASPSTRRPYLLVIAGPRVGELLPLSTSDTGETGETDRSDAENGRLVIGRDASSGLQVLDEGVSRRHALVSVDGAEVHLHDLDSTNGTFVDGVRINEHVLSEGQRFRVGQTTIIKLVWQDEIEERAQRLLLDTALRDGLTRAFNERYFRERLDAESIYAQHHSSSLAVLAINVDRFDYINRLHGRVVGDELLRRLTQVMQGTIRADDVLARTSGDNFALIGHDTGLDGGARLGERLREAVAESRFEVPAESEARASATESPESVELRISVGVTAAPMPGHLLSGELLRAASSALLRAKSKGRNRVALDESARPS